MRTMREKIETSRENAATALDAYMALPGQDDDPVTALGDLVADLLHLADQLMAEAEAEEGCEVAWDGAVSATGIIATAVSHYDYERDPEHADESV